MHSNASLFRRRVLSAWLCLGLILSVVTSAHGQSPGLNSTAMPSAGATPILPVDQVRVGMKGYGLTVFHGARVEPFAVEVVSVMRDFAPQRSVIWIRCPDPRMQQSGPVQGMSGSPIYLWNDNEPQILGKGGRLIGAFAYGYSGSKDCLVGVCPIEDMRSVGQRVNHAIARGAMLPQSQISGAGPIEQAVEPLYRAATLAGLSSQQSWRLRAVARSLELTGRANDSGAIALPAAPMSGGAMGGQVMPMRLPMMIGSPAISSALSPLLEPLGLTAAPLAGGGGVSAGTPPPGVDPQTIRFEPGGVMAVPLAFGDADLAAVGTVTEVLPDGRVLAFGHAMFGQGDVSLPMATGYVHMVMPAIATSFKLGGSAVIRGAIVRDEQAAIAGVPGGKYLTSPVKVTVRHPGQPERVYRYQAVQHKRLTPMIAAILTIQSLTAQANPPLDSTARLTGKLVFSGQRPIEFTSMVPDTNPMALALELMLPVAMMAQNPHATMMLESMDLTIDIEPTLRASTIVHARIDRAELLPGQSVRGTYRLQPFGQPATDQRFEFTLPESLPEGDYNLTLCDAPTYLSMLMANRPHLSRTSSAEDIYRLIQRIMTIRNDALYLVMPLPNQGLFVDHEEMPQLPSSRRALLAVSNSTIASPFTDWTEKSLPMKTVPSGSVNFSIKVTKNPGDNRAGAMPGPVPPPMPRR